MSALAISVTFTAHQTARASDMEQLKTDIQTAFNNSVGAQTYIPWATWTPTLTTDGTSWGPVTNSISRYCQIGKTVFFQIYAYGTLTNAINMVFTLPVAPSNTASANVGGACLTINNATNEAGFWFYTPTPSPAGIRVYRNNSAVYTSGTQCGFLIQGMYEVAS